MTGIKVSVWLTVCLIVAASSSARAEPLPVSRLQAALEAWLGERASAEQVTGVAAYVSFGDSGPAIEAFAGKTGNAAQDAPVSQATLFQMGSTSKSFAVAVLLNLEAAGKLSIDDTVGKWLPQYPAWGDVSIRRLLNMTSGIPTYSETEAMSRVWIDEPTRNLTADKLIEFAYPSGHGDLPRTTGYFYSNTNYILAGMIAEKAASRPFRDLVHDIVINRFGLDSTFYENSTYPASVADRLPHAYFANPACAGYQPGCTRSWNLPLIGRDVSRMSTSWAQAAGGAIANARDVDRWMRAVFKGRVVPPKQQAEWMSLVSTRSGAPIGDVTTDDPRGFSLGLSKAILPSLGAHWFYQGETLGFRTLYVWFDEDDLMITLQTNSQPADGADKLNELVVTVHNIVRAGAN